MQIFKLLKRHVLAVIAVVCLLAVQANAELALPSYMSEIVDVGIQQAGIESSVPRSIRADSLADLEMFMSEDDAKMVDAAFDATDADGIRMYVGDAADAKDGGHIAGAMNLPETIVLALAQGVDASALSGSSSEGATSLAPTDPSKMSPQARELSSTAEGRATLAELQQALADHDGKLSLDFIRLAFHAGLVTRDQLVDSAQAMADSMGAMGGSLVSQRAIEYVKGEYQAQGIDLNGVQTGYLARMSVRMFGLCAVSLVMAVLVGVIASRTAATVAKELRHDAFSHVMRFSPAEVSKFSQASLITRCTNDVQQIQVAITMLLRMVMLAPIMGCVAIVRVVSTHTGLEWTIGVAVIAVAATVGVLMGFTMPKFKAMQSLIDRVNLVAREMLDGLMPIRAFGRQERELKRFDDASSELMGTQLFTNRGMAFMMPLMMLVMNCVTVLIVWNGAHGVDAGVMQVGDMMAFMTYVMQIVMAFMILTMVAVMLPRAGVAAMRVTEVIDCPLSIADPATPKTPAADAPRGEVRFDHVSFAYPDADADVVTDVSFTTHAGKTTALIGPTGSGKSTLVQLIPRLYDASEGTVSIDGVDVRDLALSDLRSRIGYVPQQGRLFSGTVESNLKFAGNVSDAQMREAARIAQATEFIEGKDEGYATAIAQGGSNVSGGQRQRLAIARALAKSPEVLVFDDSFSALDYATDARLREELSRSVTDAALVVVAQRIATIMHADEILVLEEGRVVGRGTHEALLRSCPTYLEIAQSQLSDSELGMTAEEVAAVLGGSVEGGER